MRPSAEQQQENRSEALDGRGIGTRRGRQRRIEWLALSGSLFALLFAISGLTGEAIRAIDWIPILKFFKPIQARIAAVIALVQAAQLIYKLRARYPKVYAAVEGFVALTSAWLALSATNPTDQGLKFAAAVYLMVRALDNWNRPARLANTTALPLLGPRRRDGVIAPGERRGRRDTAEASERSRARMRAGW
jgi:hypothetical protein